MKFLVDTSPAKMEAKSKSLLVSGQLLTPLTGYKNWGGQFAIDNGGFSRFNRKKFASLLKRNEEHKDRCLFVACPDIVANCRRTVELWQYREQFAGGWPMAFVAQDGCEDMVIPWSEMAALFIGGGDPWKDSRAAQDLVKTAKALDIHVHIGRVNTKKRFSLYDQLGADTCDGSGIAMYDHMLEQIERHVSGQEVSESLFGSMT